MKNDQPGYVLQVMGSRSTKFGGLERLLIQLAQNLETLNVRLIIVYNERPVSEHYIKLLKEFRVILYVANSAKPIKFLKIFAGILIKYKPALVHAHFQPLFPLLFSYLLGCRLRFYSVRLMLLNKDLFEAEKISQLKWTQKIYLPVINLATTRFLAVSIAVQKQYTSFYPSTRNRFSVIYNGVDHNPYHRIHARNKFGLRDNEVCICTVAFASVIKGIDVLIDAVRILRNQNISAEFKVFIIGVDDKSILGKKLISRVLEYRLSAVIKWIGIIDNAPEFLKAMDIYCQPSRTEALPNAVMEAGMASLPCVGSNVGGMKELIQHNQNGYLFENENSCQLSEYLKKLILDKSLRKKMGLASEKIMKDKYLREKRVKELINIYSEMLQAKQI